MTTGPVALFNYVTAWSHISVPLVQTSPFSQDHLTASMRTALAEGSIVGSSLPLLAAFSYTARARGYEKILLETLGFPPEALDAFIEKRQEFGDHFQTSHYEWQGYERAAVVVAEMTGLHQAVSKAWEDVTYWKKAIGFYPDGTDYVDMGEELLAPLTSLQELLVERATHALTVREAYDVNMEAGLRAYFYRSRRRHSGVEPILAAAGIRLSDSVPPPAKAIAG